jgi:hypothetical protein
MTMGRGVGMDAYMVGLGTPQPGTPGSEPPDSSNLRGLIVVAVILVAIVVAFFVMTSNGPQTGPLNAPTPTTVAP